MTYPIKKLKFIMLLCFAYGMNICCFSQNIPKIRINPAIAFGGAVSQYFDSFTYIPLETTKESLFGDIKQLVITDSSFVIQDDDTKSILFFSLNGRYLRRIRIANGIRDFFYDQYDKKILLVGENTRSQTSYTDFFSLTGKFLSSSVASKKSLNELYSVRLEDGFEVSRRSCSRIIGELPKDSVFYLIEIYKGNRLFNSLLPYNQKNNNLFCSLGGSVGSLKNTVISDGEFFVATALEHFLYKVSKNTATKILQFVFPFEQSISDQVIKMLTNDKSIDSLRRLPFEYWVKPTTIRSVSNIFYHKQFLYFKTNPYIYSWQQGTENRHRHNFIYDTVSSKLVSIELLTPDDSNFFLPFYERKKLLTDGLFYRRGDFFSVVSSLNMFASKEATKHRNPQYPPVLQEYFKTQSRKSNPVIVRMKLKE